jgi:hypothetical protein
MLLISMLAGVLVGVSQAAPAFTPYSASDCISAAANPSWDVKNFLYSDYKTGSESSLERIISINFTATNTASGDVATCSTSVSLAQGETWNPKTTFDCSNTRNRLITQFSFDYTTNTLTITQSWVCSQASQQVYVVEVSEN